MSKSNFRWAAAWILVLSLFCSSLTGAELVDLSGNDTAVQGSSEIAEDDYVLPQIDTAVVPEAEETLPGDITAETDTMGDVISENIDIPDETVPEISDGEGNIELPDESAGLPEEFEEELPISEELFGEETIPEEAALFEEELLPEDELISLEDELLPQDELQEEAEAVEKPEESEEEEILTDAGELEDPEAVGAGNCGPSVTWSLSAGKLTISGTGEMYNYSYFDGVDANTPPWYNDRNSIKEVEIKNGVTRIGLGAFLKHEKLTKVTIASSVKTIGAAAFNRCTLLETVTIPNTVTKMEGQCFYGCSSLKSISIPGNIQFVAGAQFSFCTSLKTATIKVGSNKELPYSMFSYCPSLTSVTLPGNIEVIGSYCFADCSSLSSITLPTYLKEIGPSAFFNTKITQAVLNSGMERVGSFAFAGCKSLNYIKFPVSDTVELQSAMFAGNTSLTEVSFNPGITVITPNMFNSCTSLSSVSMPMSGVTDIEYNSFYNCKSLKKIEMPYSLKRIGAGAFDNSGLETICFFGDAPSVTKVQKNSWQVDMAECPLNPNLNTTYTKVFTNVKGFAFYPKNNSTWTEAKMKAYGGDIIWAPWDQGDGNAFGDRVLSKMNFEKDGKAIRGHADGTQETVIFYHPVTRKLSKTVFTYNGKDQRPEVILKNVNGKDVAKKHYTIVYPSASKNPGTYTVTIKLKGPYAYGSINLQYKIVLNKSKITALYNADQGIDVRWRKVNGATGYKVFRIRSGEGSKMIALVNDGNADRFYDKGVKNDWGKVFKYYVRPINGSYVGDSCDAIIVKRLAKMKFTSYKSSTAGTVSLKWALAYGTNCADGYEIQYAYSNADLTGWTGTFKQVDISGKSNLSRTIKNLKSGKTCYIRIRAWAYKNGAKTRKSYSKYSEVVTVKIK